MEFYYPHVFVNYNLRQVQLFYQEKALIFFVLQPIDCKDPLLEEDCLEDVQALIDAGEYSVKGLLERLGPDVTRVDVAARERDLLLNVNTPEDFERACALLRSD